MSVKTKEKSNGTSEVLERTVRDAATAGDQTQYDDVYVRNGFDDSGAIPYKGGSPSHSPDIIPQQDKSIQNPDVLITDENWGKDLGMDINAGLANYIYLRGMNLGTADSEEAKMYLYYSRSSLILWPQDPIDPNKGWRHNAIPTASGAQYCVLGANGVVKGSDRVATHDPFYWVPQPPPSGEHYCLIGRVATKAHPNEIPADIQSLGGMAGYICDHANMCWRNVNTIAPKNPVSTTSVNYNQGNEAANVHFYLQCTGLPVGSEVAFSAGTAGPNPAIRLEKTKVTSSESFTAGVDSDVPEQYNTNISYSYYSNGLAPADPAKFKIELKAVFIPKQDPEDELYQKAVDLVELGAPEHIVRGARERYGIGPVKGIIVGTDQVQAIEGIRPSAGPGNGLSSFLKQNLQDTYLKLQGIKWKNVRESIFGNSYTNFDFKVNPSIKNNIVVDDVSFGSEAGNASDADLVAYNSFFGGNFSGDFLVSMKTQNVPQGCAVELQGGTASYPIRINKTVVANEPIFTVGTVASLPEAFECNMNASLYTSGNRLSPEVSPTLTISIAHVDEKGDPQLGYVSLKKLGLEDLVVAAGPTPAKLIGQVTINLTPAKE